MSNTFTATDAYELSTKSLLTRIDTMKSYIMSMIKSKAKRGEFKAIILLGKDYSSTVDSIKEWLQNLNYTIERDRINNYTCHELTISWKNIPEI